LLVPRRWIVRLLGSDDALARLSQAFTVPPVQILLDGRDYRLEAAELDGLSRSQDVMNAATRLLDSATALLYVYTGIAAHVRPGNAYWIDGSGREHGIGCSVFGTLCRLEPDAMAKLTAVVPGSERPKVAAILSSAASDLVVAKLLSTIPDHEPSWADLYVLLEIIGGKRVLQGRGYASRSDLNRLFQTANYYRHGTGVSLPPVPVSIVQARGMVRGFVSRWLERRAGAG
jgi:hypothetical protein